MQNRKSPLSIALCTAFHNHCNRQRHPDRGVRNVNTTKKRDKDKNLGTMKKRHVRTIVTGAAIAFATQGAAQIPVGYYETLRGKSGAELKTAVYERISDATVLSYGSGTGHTWDGFYSTDRTPDNRVIDRYSNETWYFGERGASVSGMNIEHSFPKSWWGGAENQAYRDLYNLMPCEQKINSSKSNYPMGKVETVSTDNGCTTIGVGTEGFRVWEPADQWKGDFARGYMYMATAYQNFTWQGTQALQILEQGDYPTLQQWAYELYLEWARNDGVDSMEVARNDSVCAIQGNRNPFVDFPNLMEYIWGDSIGTDFDPSTTVATHTYLASDGSSGGDTPPEEGDTTEVALGDTIYTATFTETNGDCVIAANDVPWDGFSVWELSEDYGWKGTAYVNYTCYAADATLTTPEIDLRRVTTATLLFEHAANYVADPSAVLSVEVSHDGMTWVLDSIRWPTGSDWKFVSSGLVSLDEHAGRIVRIGFRYTSTTEEAGTWEIKKMTVTGVPQVTAITDATADTPCFDPSQPYETFTTDGRRVNADNARGLIIVRQNGMTWKMVK